MKPEPGLVIWYLRPSHSETWPLPGTNSPLSRAKRGYEKPIRTQAVMAPVSANLRVSRCPWRHMVTSSAGRTTSIVSLVRTEAAPARPAPKWCQRWRLGDAARQNASSIHITAMLSRKISRWRITDSGESPKSSMARPAAQRGSESKRPRT